MAHFAELDKDNKVLRVIVVSNEDIKDENGIEQESIGISFLQKLFGDNTNWVQTSYNGSFRKKYAAIGDEYLTKYDVFIPPRPSEYFIFDEINLEWIHENPELRSILR